MHESASGWISFHELHSRVSWLGQKSKATASIFLLLKISTIKFKNLTYKVASFYRFNLFDQTI